MSQLDSELNQLRTRIAALEEQKRIETEKAAEKKAFPLKTLQEIIAEKKRRIERKFSTPKEYQFYRGCPQTREKLYDQEKVEFLEPILNMLKDIQQRLEVLEHLADLG